MKKLNFHYLKQLNLKLFKIKKYIYFPKIMLIAGIALGPKDMAALLYYWLHPQYSILVKEQ